MSKYKEYKGLNLSDIHKNVLQNWQKFNSFGECISHGKGKPPFTFYEGPPSANGMHSMSYTEIIKFLYFCKLSKSDI